MSAAIRAQLWKVKAMSNRTQTSQGSSRHLLALLALLTICVWPDAGRALVIKGNQVIIDYGAEPEPRARVVFYKDRAARLGVTIETFRAGVAGSKLTILVDDKILFDYTFTAADCRRDNGTDSCSLAINGHDEMSGRLRNRFRRGQVSRLQLETGGVMSMTFDVPLQGFTRAMTIDN